MRFASMLFGVAMVALLATALPCQASPRSLLPQGIPDAALSSQVRVGADSASVFDARVRVYVKLDSRSEWKQPVQLSVDVGPHTGMVVLGSTF